MGKKVITIGREFGSNGRNIAKALADEVGAAFYDKELIVKASEKSGVHISKMEHADEKGANPWLYQSFDEPNQLNYSRIMPVNDFLYQVQREVILEEAEKENCIIVGRCSNYILQDHPCVCHVFIHAPIEDRIKTIQDRYQITGTEARSLVKKMDKQRRQYYEYYTKQKWGNANHYHLVLNSSKYRTGDCVLLLKRAYEMFH